jgi:Rhamnan synthesis protein F
VGPLRPYSALFAEMRPRPVDYWGLTACERVAPHLQGNLLVFRPWVVASSAFREYWKRMVPISDRSQVIRRYEVGLSQCLEAAGFRSASYFVPTRADEIAARRRVAWWAEHRPSPGSHSRPPRTLVKARAREPFNPVYALADRALEGRLPLVKIDTLRHDPYKLGAEALLTKCEDRYPHEFSGVRDFLNRTASHYPTRPGERLLRTPARAWVMWPSVRY